MEKRAITTRPPSGRQVTPALATFIREARELSRFAILGIVGASIIRDQVAHWHQFSEYYEQSGYPELVMQDVVQCDTGALVTEVVVTRTVDSYLAYLMGLLTEIAVQRPEVLWSSAQVTLEFIVQFSTIEDLVRALAERRIDRLACAGAAKLAQFFDARLGLPLVDQPEHMGVVVELVEVRNVIVHHHGTINKAFKQRLPAYPGEIGERVQVPDLADKFNVLTESANNLDRASVAKFGLANLVPLPARTRVMGPA
jgi:hypothetical protein